jgi:tetratricopeptide (TPR) repeat protein
MATQAASLGFASDPMWQQAQACLVRGQVAAARAALASMQALRPAGDVYAHLLAAQIAWREDRVRDGTRHALDAARVVPEDAEALCTVAAVLIEAGETIAARACLDRPAWADCGNPLLLMRAAGLRKRLEQHAETLATLDEAEALGHASAALRFRRGEALMFNGRLDEAEAELAASLAEAPAHGSVAVPLVRVRKQTAERNHLALLERSARQVAPGSREQAALEFARYKTLEDLGRDDEAWQALVRGNALMHARLREQAAQHRAWLDRFLSVWSTVDRRRGSDPSNGPMPIFIIGMARSGTTLLERMLGNHSRVAVAGELMDFGAQLHWMADTRNAQSDRLLSRLPRLDCAELGRRYLAQTQWRAHGKAFFIDKQPPNWVLAGPIHLALPRAPILNLVRDPMDTCFSNWRAYFGDACAYSYDLDALAAHFNDYRRVMAYWHRVMPGAILDVPYAELVSEPETALRKVFDFCGLQWEPGCADIARNASPSATLSAAQVRGALRRDTGGQWQRYAPQLAPLVTALSRHDIEPAPAARECVGAEVLPAVSQDARASLAAARLALKEDCIRDATRAALEAAASVPDDPAALLDTVDVLLQVGEIVAARRCMADPGLAQTRDPRHLLRLARHRQRLDENAEALRLIERAIAEGVDDPRASFDHGVQLYFNGRLGEAEARLRDDLIASPVPGRTALALARLRKWTVQDNHLDLFAANLQRVPVGGQDHAALLFAQYKELEDTGRYEEAWQALMQGNAVMHARRPWDADGHSRSVDKLISACDAARVVPAGETSPGPQPIFILGMPRSGTTVLERMLGNHSSVAPAGELTDFGMQLHWAADTAHTHSDTFIARVPGLDLAAVGERYLAQTRWRAHGKNFFIDKQPPNWILAGLIHAALPSARILHLVRDPMDTCFSNWRAFFGDAYAYSYDLGALAAYFNDYRRVMAHWHAVIPGAILDVSYAELVSEPEATLRKVFAFCGLEWEAGCADITRNASPSATLSAAQVRGPLRGDTSGGWRRYAGPLRQFEEALMQTVADGAKSRGSGRVADA